MFIKSPYNDLPPELEKMSMHISVYRGLVYDYNKYKEAVNLINETPEKIVYAQIEFERKEFRNLMSVTDKFKIEFFKESLRIMKIIEAKIDEYENGIYTLDWNNKVSENSSNNHLMFSTAEKKSANIYLCNDNLIKITQKYMGRAVPDEEWHSSKKQTRRKK